MEPVFTSYDLTNEPSAVPKAFYPSVIVVQARMGSTRLPGKVLRTLSEKSLLQIQIERLRAVTSVDAICVATTVRPEDNQIAHFCDEHSVHCYRGDSEDVLSRFYAVAKGFDAEVVIRITADCPFIDPHLIEKALFCFRNHYDELDYLTNTLHRTYPRGMDIEIMRTTALEESFHQAILPYDKEHVTPYMRSQPTNRLGNFFQKEDFSYMRLTVDTEEDFQLIQEVYKRIQDKNCFDLEEIVRIVKKEPDLLRINAHIEQRK